MRMMILALAAALAATSAVASDKTDVMAVVKQAVDDSNKGDMKAMAALCAANTSIIDEFPPHAWQGPTACSDWSNDFDAYNKKNGITDGVVTLGKARHIDVSGDRAYVVIPAKFAYKQNGKPVVESGSIFTVALQKVAAGWRVTGFAWAEH
ncbi:MAG TPA: nuclear transport factor 2 family protein [Rhizomicrobium sp.]|nr:nuclear transport factor 2 family protein [Rhizomicrobium sp.]